MLEIFKLSIFGMSSFAENPGFAPVCAGKTGARD
jgi:hypothetical protein